MPPTKAYCGTDKVPKDKHKGSLEECIKNKQVRSFGTAKIDSKILDAAKNKKLKSQSKDKLMIEKAKKTGKLSSLIKKIPKQTSPAEKDKLKTQAKRLQSEIKKIDIEINKFRKISK